MIWPVLSDLSPTEPSVRLLGFTFPQTQRCWLTVAVETSWCSHLSNRAVGSWIFRWGSLH